MAVPVAGEKKAVTRSLNSWVTGLEPDAGDESEHEGTPAFGGDVLNLDAKSECAAALCSLGCLKRLFGLGEDDLLEVRVFVVIDQLRVVLSLLTVTHFYTFGSMRAHAYAFERAVSVV